MVEPAALVGQVVDGRWLLVDHLGSGHFGDVYSAEPRHLELSAGAVKVVRPRNDADRRQILSEINALAELTHDGLLGYRDAGEIHEGVLAGGIYIVTELCDGTLADQPGYATGSGSFEMELSRAVHAIAEALAYLHGKGFIHRDVKPTNILRSGDSWKLSDFGLMIDQSKDTVASKALQGTAPYLAPETSKSGAGPAADIYALGVVVHEALAGGWPYQPNESQWNGPPLTKGASISISDEIPKAWRPLIEVCLDPDPTHRPTAEQIPPLVPDPHRPSVRGPRPVPSKTKRVDTLEPDRGLSKRTKRALATVALGVVALAAIVTWAVARDDNPASVLTDSDTATLEDGALHISGDITLDADQTVPIVIDGDGVTLDCAGHSITGPDSTSEISGILLDVTSNASRVRNCVVSGFGVGIAVIGTGAIIDENVVRRNGIGMVINADNNQLSGNTASDNSLDGFPGPGCVGQRSRGEPSRRKRDRLQSRTGSERPTRRQYRSQQRRRL